MGHHDEPTGVQHGARRVLMVALALNAALLVVELIAGLTFGSLALVADAVHQGSDVAALGIALGAQILVTRPGSSRHTYGLRRAEALGAQANAALLVVAAVWVFIEAAQRFGTPETVDGGGVVIVATGALAINLLSAVLLSRLHQHDLNVRGAFLHMTADAAGSAGAILAGVAVLAFGASWADPTASILIGLLVIASAWGLLRDTTNVLLEGAPRNVDMDALEAALVEQPGVTAVHHLHVWELASDLPALSVHIVLNGEPTLHDAQTEGDRLRAMLASRFGIEHATLELECHDCEGAVHSPAPRGTVEGTRGSPS